MNRLPFVWELNYEGIVSHAIGSPHGIQWFSADKYIKDIVYYLDGKCAVLAEAEINQGGTIDAVIIDIAKEKSIPRKIVTAEKERKAFDEYYSVYLDCPQADRAYRKGDAKMLKAIYGRPGFNLDQFTWNLAERSLRWLKTTPSLLVANLAHFIIEPTILAHFQKRGIQPKI
ncbi:MAG: hypothetical protein QW165_03060 [Candidatus Woesearchaeota archaeon]